MVADNSSGIDYRGREERCEVVSKDWEGVDRGWAGVATEIATEGATEVATRVGCHGRMGVMAT